MARHYLTQNPVMFFFLLYFCIQRSIEKAKSFTETREFDVQSLCI